MSGSNGADFPYVDFSDYEELTSPDIKALGNSDPYEMLGKVAQSAARSEKYLRHFMASHRQMVDVVNQHSAALQQLKKQANLNMLGGAGFIGAVIFIIQILKQAGVLK